MKSRIEKSAHKLGKLATLQRKKSSSMELMVKEGILLNIGHCWSYCYARNGFRVDF